LAIVVPQLIWGMPGRPFGGSRPAGLEGDRDCTNSNFKANIQISIHWYRLAKRHFFVSLALSCSQEDKKCKWQNGTTLVFFQSTRDKNLDVHS
jgi:hypothetical protein